MDEYAITMTVAYNFTVKADSDREALALAMAYDYLADEKSHGGMEGCYIWNVTKGEEANV